MLIVIPIFKNNKKELKEYTRKYLFNTEKIVMKGQRNKKVETVQKINSKVAGINPVLSVIKCNLH